MIIAGSVLFSERNPNQSDPIRINQSSAIPRCNNKTKTVKKDSSSSTTDAESPVDSSTSTITTDTEFLVIAQCTSLHQDPYQYAQTSSKDPVPCCDGLEMTLKDWNKDGTERYQCERPARCTGIHDDPYGSGGNVPGNVPVPCCDGLKMQYKVSKKDNEWHWECDENTESQCCTMGIGCTEDDDCCYQFGNPDPFHIAPCTMDDRVGCCVGECTYPVGRQSCNPWVVPRPKESDCCTTGIGCTENHDCCAEGTFGDPAYCKLDTNGCCVGQCTFPAGRQLCNPWYPVPYDTCVPAIGDFSGSSVTVVPTPYIDSLKYPFETCYAGSVSDYCYTQSWTDGFGNYYPCFPKNPNEGTPRGNPWSPFTFDAKDYPNFSCQKPCQDLAPATKPVKPCRPDGAPCGENDHCCNGCYFGSCNGRDPFPCAMPPCSAF